MVLGMQSVELSEQADEEQIIREMKGEILNSYIYSFNQGGREVTGLSYAGVKQAIRKRGRYELVPCKCCNQHVHIDEDETEIRAIVKVHDKVNDVEFLGASGADRKKPFAYVLAVNKAERNAFRKLLPEKELSEIIKEYKRQQSSSPLRVQ